MPDINWSVRVVDEDGEGVEGAAVFVDYGWTAETGYTDDDGWVEFLKPNFMDSGARVKIYVDSQLMGEPWVEDGDTLSYTV
jgi:hypothetical protein